LYNTATSKFKYISGSIITDWIHSQGVETADPSYFVTPENIERLNQAKEAKRVQV